MLSGNGRHRRPRQAPALVVAAGVTGSAIAIPLLGATGAHAADGANWDRVAECETGGSWSQSSGNGYYGGLQLSQDVWEQYGGLEYASSADQASRSQQIRIAEKLRADQGIAAWPTCGLLAGLGNDSGSSAGGTGAAEKGASQGADDEGTPTAPRSPAASGTGSSGSSGSSEESERASGVSPSSPPSATSDSPSADSDETTKADTTPGTGSSATPDLQETDRSSTATTKDDETDKAGRSAGSSAPTDTAGSGAGKHRGDRAEEGVEGVEEGRGSDASGRHASRGEGEARGVVDGSYTVRSGDSLWGIADSLELDGGWRSLYVGNEEVVGTDPDHILPGQTLTLGGETGQK
ncbi:transglycosylase family protein [Streptomyces sp. NPDC056568]|uniref:transglycosylase family protein n=1 Tax=Streptomyces sp. NPDC056568 TaxID=3345866 RepID=UPI00369DF32E